MFPPNKRQTQRADAHVSVKNHWGTNNYVRGAFPLLIGALPGAVAGETLEQKMTTLKQLGFDFLELAISKDETRSLTNEQIDGYVVLTERTGLPILSLCMGHFGDFAALDDAGRQQIIDDIRKLFPLMQAVGADSVLLATTESGSRVADYSAVYREWLKPVADEALDLGITLALEHVGWYKPHHLAELVRAIDHPAVRIYFDMGNCLYVGENPIEMARICAPLTAQLHVKGGPVAPLASMPLVAIREILQNAGFQGRCCLEIKPMEGHRPLAEARALLKMAGYA